jgi:hypothetical protein
MTEPGLDEELDEAPSSWRVAVVEAAPFPLLLLAGAGFLLLSGLAAWGALLGGGLVSGFAWLTRVAIRAAPAKLPLKELSEPLNETAQGSVAALELLGFAQGDAFSAQMGAGEVGFVPLVHPEHPVYAAVYQAPDGSTAVDFVTVDEGMRVMLSTANHDQAGTLPGPSWAFRQVLPDMEPEPLLERHLEGVAWLVERGVAPEAADPGRYHAVLRRTYRLLHEFMIRAPYRRTAVILSRMLRGTSPHHGTLAEQSGREDALRRLQGR